MTTTIRGTIPDTIPCTNSRLTTVALSVLAMLYVVGCEDSGSKGSQTQKHAFDINAYPLNKVVCDPIGGGGGGAMPKKGIKAELFYKAQNQSRYFKAQDYIDFTTKADQNIFFTDMFVPTRMFSEGFSTQTGQVLKDDTGQKLIEYFGLKMNTNIRLAEEDEDGVYEFALLSDDGSVMKIKNGNAWTEVINNDGDHPTRLGCSTQKFTMTRETKLQTEVLYYQGPRYHISNVLLWRRLSASEAAGQDQSCGLTGNETWFNPNNNSAPTQNFQSLLSRGWQVLKPDNFYLPEESTEQTQYNPCTEGQNPMVSNLRVSEIVAEGVFVSWNTDVPATSQLLIINKATGQTILTQSDNILRTAHNVQYLNLSSGTTYQVQAISVSEDLGRVVSSPLEFTTP